MNRDDVESLKEAIIAEAKRDRERILSEAEAQTRTLREQAEANAEALWDQIVSRAREKAAELKQEAISSAQLEARAVRARERESLLSEVFDRAARCLSEPGGLPDYEAVVEDLVTDAVSHMGNVEAFTIHADELAAELLRNHVLERLEEETGLTMSLGETLTGEIGILVESQDGRLRYDNTLSARLARLRPALRTPVYRILTKAKT
ncbi:MAG: V-type ATP synthase subunit E [Anaerolineae bacterium]